VNALQILSRWFEMLEQEENEMKTYKLEIVMDAEDIDDFISEVATLIGKPLYEHITEIKEKEE